MYTIVLNERGNRYFLLWRGIGPDIEINIVNEFTLYCIERICSYKYHYL